MASRNLAFLTLLVLGLSLLIVQVSATDFNTASNATDYLLTNGTCYGGCFTKMRDGYTGAIAAYSSALSEWFWGYNFSSSKIIDKVRWYSAAGLSRNGNFRVQRSDDGDTWTTVSGITATDMSVALDSSNAQAPDANGWNGVSFAPTAAKYWRADFTSFYFGGDGNAVVTETEAYETTQTRKYLTIQTPGDFDRWYYPINLTMHNTTGVNAGPDVFTNGTTLPDWSDVRFYAPDGITDIPFFLDTDSRREYTDTSVIAWVQVPRINRTGTDNFIVLTYGNSPAHLSNPDEVFLLYDDFPGNSLDIFKWPGGCGASVGNSLLTIACGVWGWFPSNTTSGYEWTDFNLSYQANLTFSPHYNGGYLWYITGFEFIDSRAIFQPYDGASLILGGASYQTYLTTWQDTVATSDATLMSTSTAWQKYGIRINRTAATASTDDSGWIGLTTTNIPTGDPLLVNYVSNDNAMSMSIDEVRVWNHTTPEPGLGPWSDTGPGPGPGPGGENPITFTCTPRVQVRGRYFVCNSTNTTQADWFSIDNLFPGNRTTGNITIQATLPGYHSLVLLASNGTLNYTFPSGPRYFWIPKPIPGVPQPSPTFPPTPTPVSPGLVVLALAFGIALKRGAS